MKKFENTRKNLDILIEECLELGQIASKIKRFGANNIDPREYAEKTTNLEKMIVEMGDVRAMIKILMVDFNIHDDDVVEAEKNKVKKLLK